MQKNVINMNEKKTNKSTLYYILGTMGSHVSFIFSGYNFYFGAVKPSFFHGLLGSKGRM